jgi:AraC-like DNA-binding protein
VTESNAFSIIALSKEKPDLLPDLFKEKKNRVELVFVRAGYLIRVCNFNEIRINRNDIHLSLSATPSAIGEMSPDIEGYYCRFDSSFYPKENLGCELEIISSFLYRYPLCLNKNVFQRLSADFDAIFRLYNEREVDYPLIQAYLLACIYEIRKLMRESSLDFYPAKAFSITKQYNDLLNIHIEKKQSIAFYAGELKITPNHLNKSVKSVTGKTAIQLLTEARLAEAQSRLKHTEAMVGEIAYRLGFEDLSYFSRLFKKTVGITPAEFRKRNQRLSC